jgi:phosphate transport system substrate-binding protein
MILVACSTPGSSESPSGSGPTDTLSGDLVISGSSTVKPITSLVAEAFGNLHADVTYSVDGPGTGDGFALFCNGETDISNASRPIKDEEAASCESAGVHYIGLKIGIDGLSVITSVNNTGITCLSFLDLYALIGPESQGFTTWDAANGLAANLASTLGTDLGTSHAPYAAADLEVPDLARSRAPLTRSSSWRSRRLPRRANRKSPPGPITTRPLMTTSSSAA